LNLAILFDSDHPTVEGDYGTPIRAMILETGILQACGRHLRVRIGDVLTLFHARTEAQLRELADQVYFTHPWRLIDEERLRSTYGKATIFAWAVENVDEVTARRLHDALSKSDVYVRMHAIDLRIPTHFVLYRRSLPARYRIQGRSCQIFFDMGERDEYGDWEAKELMQLGFDQVEYEDRGAHDTIFDSFDTAEHFECVENFKAVVAGYFEDADAADELVILIEDLNPRLFKALLHRARNEEELAQAGLSMRRYLEQLADALFPARSEDYKGHDVSRTAVKNRLWAFLDTAIPDSISDKRELLNSRGKQIDRMVDEANVALHANIERKRAEKLFMDLTSNTFELLKLDPMLTRKPYDPFEEKLVAFFRD
jgi:hypothetical protein